MHRLDAQIAIADAFDSGRLGRQANSQEIAQVAGIGVKRVPRVILGINCKMVKIRTAVREWIPARFTPPRSRGTLRPGGKKP